MNLARYAWNGEKQDYVDTGKAHPTTAERFDHLSACEKANWSEAVYRYVLLDENNDNAGEFFFNTPDL